jgi:hypothetical protein
VKGLILGTAMLAFAAPAAAQDKALLAGGAVAGLRGSFSTRLAARYANAAAIVALRRMSSGWSRS